MKTFLFSIFVIVFILFFVCLFMLSRLNIRLSHLKKDASADPVTGGLNEYGFLCRSKKILAQQFRSCAIVCMELPELRRIGTLYDSEGYHRFLRGILSTLAAQLGGDLLPARISQDTFCFLLRNRKRDEIIAKLDKIHTALNQVKNSSFNFSPRFGIYFPESGKEAPEIMLEKAISAVMHIPAGKNYCFHDQEQAERAAKDLEIVRSIPRALSAGEFVVYFQPKIRVSDQRIVGAEALVRWRSSRDGLISPDMFLPAADQYHTADQIDRFVFSEVCRILARWETMNYEICPISVNLSASSFHRKNLPEEFFRISQKFGVSPAHIEFDIREDLLLDSTVYTKELLEQVHKFGFRCAVDRFGSDICSLQMLGSLEIDTINLDRSFFTGDHNNRRGRYLIENILKLSAQLQIRTTTVGVDNPGQIQYLRQAACDTIQGFHYFKPMPLDKLEEVIFSNGSLRYIEDHPDGKDGSSGKNLSAHTMLATRKNVILFTYYPEEDIVEFSDVFSPVLGSQTVFQNAYALFRTTDLIHENDRKDFLRLLERAQRETGWVENTLRFYMPGGRYEWLELRMHRTQPIAGGVISGALSDMSVWKNEVNRWKEKATRDPLTGVFNREYFEQTVHTVLEKQQHPTAALLFVDVDNFKSFNDTYGHMVGDDVLCFVSKQIMGVFRHSDIIARYGGDEFVVFAPSIEKKVLEERLEKLFRTFQYPYRNGTEEMNVTVTMGAALYPADGEDYENLLHHADCALYEAKERGKNCYILYSPEMQGEPDEQ